MDHRTHLPELKPGSRPPSPATNQNGCDPGGGTGGGGGPKLAMTSHGGTPGPGAYSPAVPESSPAITMGARPASRLPDIAMPGPGTYSTPAASQGPSYSMTGKDANKAVSSSPGPGAYYPAAQSGAPAITMAARHQRPNAGARKLGGTPGPGDYFIATQSESPSYSMGRKGSPPRRSNHPGPGAYYPGALRGPMAPSVSLAGRLPARTEPLHVLSPGPGSYDVLSSSRSAAEEPRYRLFSRRAMMGKDTLPGPGSYYVNSRYTRPSPPAYSFGGHLSKPITDAAFTPGPGTYNLRTGKTSGPCYSITGREESFKRSDTPGPGAYQRHYDPDGPSYSLGGRISPARAGGASPGPGAYHHESKSHGPAFSLLSRFQQAARQADGTPGPGRYFSETSCCSRSSSPSYSLGGKPLDRIPEPAPGPGQYSLPSTHEGPAFSLLAKVAHLKASDTPGPGRYNVVPARPDSPAFSFGSRVAAGAPTGGRAESPGPGQYNTGSGQHSLSFSFGMRPPGSKRILGPGPGSYELWNKRAGPAHSIHGRLRGARGGRGSGPGPGTYNVVARPDGPAFTLHSRTGLIPGWQSQTPGPGAYEPSRSFVSHSAPRFSLGQRLPSSYLPQHVDLDWRPGPGSYSPSLRPDGPAFTIHCRF